MTLSMWNSLPRFTQSDIDLAELCGAEWMKKEILGKSALIIFKARVSFHEEVEMGISHLIKKEDVENLSPSAVVEAAHKEAKNGE